MANNEFQSIFTVEFEDFNIVKSKLDNLQKKISNSNSSGIKLDVDIGNINKILEDVTKLSKTNIQILPSGQVKVINTLNDELGKTIKLTEDLSSGKVKIDLGNNFEKQAKAEAKEQEKIAKERINLAKQLAKEEQQQRLESQSLAKKQLEDYANMEKTINQNKLNSARKEAEENNRILQENYLAEQKLADQIANGREKAELKKQQAIKKTEEAQTKAINAELENTKKAEASAKTEEQNAKKLIEYEKEKLKLKQQSIELNRGSLVSSTKSSDIGSSIENLSGKTTSEVRENVRKLSLELDKLDQAAKLKGVEVGQHNVSSLGDAFKSTMSKLGIFASTTVIIREFSNQLRQAIQYTVDMDKNLTNIMMITGKSSSAITTLTTEFKSLGDELHTTNREIMSASEEILRAGYDSETSKKMVEASIIGAKVSGQTSAQVTEQLIAIKNAFNMTGDELMAVIDSMAEMDRTSATSFSELSQAVMRTAFSAQEMGTSFDDLLSYVTVVSEKTRRSADTIGEAFKSIYSRYANVKLGNLDEDGKSISDVEEALKRVDIQLRDSVGNFRDFDDVLKEFMDRVKSGNVSQIDKFAIVNALAGTRQKETLLALIENTDALAKHQEDLANSTGMAKEMFDNAYSGSLDAKINDLKRSFEGLYESMLNSSTLKFGLDISTDTINGLSKFIDTFGMIPSMTTVIVGGLTLFNDKFRESTSFLSKFALGVTGLQPKLDGLNAALQRKAKVLDTDIRITKGLIEENKKAGDGTAVLSAKLSLYEAQLTATNVKIALLKAGTLLLQGVMTMGLSLAITGAISMLFKLGDSLINAKSNLKEFNDEFISNSESDSTSSAQGLVDKYKSLSEQLKNTTKDTEEYKNKEKELKTTLDELVSVYPQAATSIDNDTNSKLLNVDATQKLIDKDKELLKAQANKVVSKNDLYSVTGAKDLVGDYNNARKELEKLNDLASKGVKEVKINGAMHSVEGALQRTSEEFKQYESAIRASLPALKILSEENGELKSVYDILNQSINGTSDGLYDGANSIDQYGDSLNDLQTDIVSTTDALKGFSDTFSGLGSDIDLLSKGLEEFSQYGYLSADTMSKFLSSGDTQLISLLADANSFMERGNQLITEKKSLQEQAMQDAINYANQEIMAKNAEVQNFTEAELVKINTALQANQSIVESSAEAVNINKTNYGIDSDNKTLAEIAKLKSVSSFLNNMDGANANVINALKDKYGIDVSNFVGSLNAKTNALNQWAHEASITVNGIVQAMGGAGSLWTNNPYKLANQIIAGYVGSSYSGQSVSGGNYTGNVGIGNVGGSSGTSGGSSGSSSGKTDTEKQAQDEADARVKAEEEANKTILDMRSKLVDLLKKKYTEMRDAEISAIDDQISELEKQLKRLEDGYVTSEERKAQIEQEMEKWKNDDSDYGNKKYLELQKEYEKESIKAQIEAKEEEKSLVEKKWDERLQNDKLYQEATLLLQNQKYDEITKLFKDYGELFTETMGDINTYIKEMIDSLKAAQSLVGNTGGQSKPTTPSTGSTGGSSGSGSSSGGSALAKGTKIRINDVGSTIYVDSYTSKSSGTVKGAGVSSNDPLYITNLNNGRAAVGRNSNVNSSLFWLPLDKIARFNIGGAIGDVGKNGALGILDSNERVLTASQNKSFEKLIDILPKIMIPNMRYDLPSQGNEIINIEITNTFNGIPKDVGKQVTDSIDVAFSKFKKRNNKMK